MTTPVAPVPRRLPGIARRLACMAYEALSLFGLLLVAFLLPHVVISGVRGTQPLPGWILWVHIFLVLMVYFVWFWRHGGQTLAMKTWKIRLVAADRDDAPTIAQMLLRYVLGWPSVLLFGIGLLWALIDRDRQFLHDRLAGTRIEFAPGSGKDG